MKRIKLFFTAVCSVLMLSSLPSSVFAGGYTYQVTFDAGNQGTIDSTAGLFVNNSATGSSYQVGTENGKIVVSGLQAQDIVTFEPQAGAVRLKENSKYYIKGVRQSGRDNHMAVSSSFRVTGDADYVVAYGIRGNIVEYTANYQDQNGTTLETSRKFYGNVGDKPVVAHVYVEGYTPQALALTKTLSSNASENIFTFVYEKNDTEVITRPGQTVTETVTETVVVPGESSGTTETETTEEQDLERENADSENTGSKETVSETEPADSKTTESKSPEQMEVSGAETTEPQEEITEIREEEVPKASQEVIDLDEEETPLGKMELDREEAEKGIPLAAGVGIAAAAVTALAGLVWFLRKQKKV